VAAIALPLPSRCADNGHQIGKAFEETILRTLAALLFACVLVSPAQLQAAELPKRKPGHWRITTVSPSFGLTTVDACVGEKDNIALPADSGDCSEPKVTQAGSEVIVDVVCTKPHGKQIMSTAFGGDFNARYHGVMKMSFDPPEGWKNMGVTIDGSYVGAECPPDASAKKAG
jgi:hypothetical protein